MIYPRQAHKMYVRHLKSENRRLQHKIYQASNTFNEYKVECDIQNVNRRYATHGLVDLYQVFYWMNNYGRFWIWSAIYWPVEICIGWPTAIFVSHCIKEPFSTVFNFASSVIFALLVHVWLFSVERYCRNSYE